MRCRQQLREISENDNEEEQVADTEVSFVLSTHIYQVNNKVPKLNLKVNGIYVNALIDTSSTLNTVPENITENIHQSLDCKNHGQKFMPLDKQSP